jgi:hypothetical protein
VWKICWREERADAQRQEMVWFGHLAMELVVTVVEEPSLHAPLSFPAYRNPFEIFQPVVRDAVPSCFGYFPMRLNVTK